MKDIDLADLQNIGSWPLALKIAVIAIAVAAVGAAGFFFDTKSQIEKLERAERKEEQLKDEFRKKQAKAVNLDAYKQQMKEMEESFGAMLRQLPSKTEVEDLLVDISQTGLASGIEFNLFKPQSERFIEFYAELPIQMQMRGTYHEFGNFVSGIAALPRIVTLHNIKISGGGGGNLSMSVTAKTYRYLDEDELSAQRKSKKRRRR